MAYLHRHKEEERNIEEDPGLPQPLTTATT